MLSFQPVRISYVVVFFQIELNSCLVSREALKEFGIPEETLAATCVLVDMLENVPMAGCHPRRARGIGLGSLPREKVVI